MNLDFIAFPLGRFFSFIFNTLAFQNYGLAIIIFTVIVRLVLLPLTIKQYHSTTKMQSIQPQIQELQKRYKNDKEKLNQEMMKLYQEQGVNPAGGCLPLLIQMPILIALYYIIAQPLKFMLQLGLNPKMLMPTGEMIKNIDSVISKLFNLIPKEAVVSATMKDISIINYFTKFPEKLSDAVGLITKGDLISMRFLGLNLGLVPTYKPALLFGPDMWQYLPLLLIPLLAAATTYIQSKIMTPQGGSAQGAAAGAAGSMQTSMLVIMPIMILIFAFQFPAGMGLYWIVGNIIQIFSQLYINKYIIKKKEVVKS